MTNIKVSIRFFEDREVRPFGTSKTPGGGLVCWMDLKKRLKKCVDWNKISKLDYLRTQ